MSGNATYRLANTAILSVSAVEAPIVKTSAEFDEQLNETYQRVQMSGGKLEELAGVYERRWWPEDVSFADGAAMAGRKALKEAGVEPEQIGVMINTSVSRAYLEPSTAVDVHDQLGLGTHCLNFDLANACLGFVNGMQLAGTMIDAGQIDYALIVDAEGSRQVQQATLNRLAGEDATAEDLKAQFATLTIGSGAAAMVLGRADAHPDGHRVVGGASRAGTEHNDLCVGDWELMRTDTRRLFEAGIALAHETWKDAEADFDWTNMDAYIAHQTSRVHLEGLSGMLGLTMDRFPLTLKTFGNMGPAAVPFTLAKHAENLSAGDRVLLMGIGSGLNTSFAEITW